LTLTGDSSVRGRTTRATLFVVLSACCFGSLGPLTVIALENGARLEGVQSWRYGVSALLLLAYASRHRASGGAGPRDGGVRPWYHPRTLLVAGGGQAAVATLALLALRWIPAATASFLFYTFPVWVTLLTAMRGIERLTGARIVALLLAVGGIVAMVGAPDAGSLHPTGVALALAAALLYALYIPVLGALQQRRSPADVALAMSVGAGICFLAWSLATGALGDRLNLIALGASILQGVLSTFAFIGFLAGLSQIGPVRTAITSTVEPFWTTLLGVLLLSQPAGTGMLAGGACIMAAVVVLQRVAKAPLHSSTAREAGHPGHPAP